MSRAGGEPRGARLYRRLLRLYPRSFRRAYGAELERFFRHQRREERYRGSLGTGRFWAEVLCDLVLGLGRQWLGRAATRRRRGGGLLASTTRELRLAARSLARSPAFSSAAVLSLALGMGATTALFSLANAFLLRPLPGIAAQGELYNLHPLDADGELSGGFSYPDYLDLQETGRAFSDVAAFTDRFLSLRRGDGAEGILGVLVSGSYFPTLGVEPAAGRFFRDEEEGTPDAHPVVVISHRLWQERYGGSDQALGTELHVNGAALTVIGVAPEGFLGTFHLFPYDLWMPLAMAEVISPGSGLDRRDEPAVEVVARLASGVTPEQAADYLEGFTRGLEAEHPASHGGFGIEMRSTSGVEDSLRGGVVAFLSLLLAVTALVLLIACGNVANMLLARTAARRRDTAVRLAIGAGRRHVFARTLGEGLLLAGSGAIGGLLLGAWAADGLRAFAPPIGLPLVLDFGLDARVLAFAAGVAVVAGIGCALVPALRAAGSSLVPALKGEADDGRGSARARGAFVVAQIAVSLLLLVTAGLFLRTLLEAASLDPGFEPEGVQLATINTSVLAAESLDHRRFFERLLAALESAPEVAEVALVRRVPLTLGATSSARVAVPGRQPPPGEDGFPTDLNTVAPGYFELLRIPLLAGRDFTAGDGPEALPVAIVSREMAERLWPGEGVVGRELLHDDRRLRVVGVAADTKVRSLGEAPRPLLYLPFAQRPGARMTLLLRGRGEPGVLAAAVRREVGLLERDLPIMISMPLESFLALTLLPQRMAGWITGLLGVLGLALAAVGIYGVAAYSAGQRRRELSIRLSLGASQRDVAWLVVRQWLRAALWGIALGSLAALALTRLLAGLLHGISPSDPLTFGAIAALLAATALVASYLPARRVARRDPMAALRTD